MAIKLPPYDLEIEKMVLGSIISLSSAMNDVRNIINVDCFYDKFNADVFNAIKESKVKESKVKENKEEENIRSEQKVPSTNTQFEKFNLWLKKEAPNVLKIKNQITEAQFEKLKQTYNSKQIMDIVLNLDNFKDAPKKYTNVNRTVTNWLQRENNKTK